MRKRMLRSAAVAAAALMVVTLFAGPASASARVSTAMSGTEETPPNASTATGTFTARVSPYRGKVCYTLTWQDLSSNAIAAHIHEAPPGVAGPIVVPLTIAASTSGTTTECKTGLDHAVLRQIARHPTRFYVNVHSENFPGGEIRGQLSKAKTV